MPGAVGTRADEYSGALELVSKAVRKVGQAPDPDRWVGLPLTPRAGLRLGQDHCNIAGTLGHCAGNEGKGTDQKASEEGPARDSIHPKGTEI